MKVVAFNTIDQDARLASALEYDFDTNASRSMGWSTGVANQNLLSMAVRDGKVYGAVGGRDELSGRQALTSVFVGNTTTPPSEVAVFSLAAQPISGIVAYSPDRKIGVGLGASFSSYLVVDLTGTPSVSTHAIGSFPLNASPPMMLFDDGSVRFLDISQGLARLSTVAGLGALDVAASMAFEDAAISDNDYVNGCALIAKLAKKAKEQGLGTAISSDLIRTVYLPNGQVLFQPWGGQVAFADDIFRVGYQADMSDDFVEVEASLDGAYEVLTSKPMPITDYSVISSYQFTVQASVTKSFWTNFVRAFETV